MAQSFRTDEEAEAVIEEYSLTVYRLALAQLQSKSDADDVFQEVFLRYIRKTPSFLSKEHEKAWFLRVTLNCCRNVWNSPFRKHTAELSEELAAGEREESGLDEALCRLQKKENLRLRLRIGRRQPFGKHQGTACLQS